ncbi:MAG: hypothetical protein LUG51_17780 [Tannerellaceae bacterium]|nr:hypothetical protein [Tannerellaceae bacterium]
MIIEELRWLSEDLFKEADEAIPLIGGANKKRWMAQRLDEIIGQGGTLLDQFLRYESKDEVVDRLDKEYDVAGHPKVDNLIPEKEDPDAKTWTEMDPMRNDRPVQPEYVDEGPEFQPGDLSEPGNKTYNCRK